MPDSQHVTMVSASIAGTEKTLESGAAGAEDQMIAKRCK